MSYVPAVLDDLARVFAEAALREMEKENAIASKPGRGDGIASGEYNDTIHPNTESRQALR